jgi:hypothetical protein
MLNKTKYWKSTLGIFADVLIAKQVDYSGTGAATGVTDFPTFVSTAAEGEFAFFNADTLALIAGTTSGSPAAVTAVGSTTWIFGALKRDGAVEKTGRFRLSSYTATRIPYAAAVAQVSTAAFSGTPTAGKYYSVKVIETTPGYQPFPSWEYGVTIKTGESMATALGRIRDLINDKTNVVNKDTDSIVTATLSSTTLTITATTGGPTFRLAFSYDALNDGSAVAAYTTNAFWGNGTYAQVAELEKEANVYKGVTTQYPMQGANPEDFGQPTAFATSGVQYSTYIITGVATELSPTPVDQHQQPRNILLAIPSNGSANAEAEVKGILGL